LQYYWLRHPIAGWDLHPLKTNTFFTAHISDVHFPSCPFFPPGGGLRGGQVIGATDPEGTKNPAGPTTVEDVHAAVLKVLGLDPLKENIVPLTGRPVKLSAGRPIRELLG